MLDKQIRGALEGRRVLALYVADTGHQLALVTDRARPSILLLDTHGDCCSESWWADAVGVKQLVGARVTAVEDIDLADYDVDDGRGRQCSDAAYGVRLRTDQGACELIFRNSSNGYYGGWCDASWVNDLPAPPLQPLTLDWRA